MSTTTTTTETSKDAQGNTTGTTTSTTTTGGTGTSTGTSSGTGSGSDDQPDLCALHPDALACDTLGTPPSDGPTWGTRDVTFTPEDIGMPSGCPGPRTFTVHGIVFTLDYQPACDIAPLVKAGLVAFCALGCMLWIMATVRA